MSKITDKRPDIKTCNPLEIPDEVKPSPCPLIGMYVCDWPHCRCDLMAGTKYNGLKA